MAADTTTLEFQEHSVSLESKVSDNIFFFQFMQIMFTVTAFLILYFAHNLITSRI